MSIFAGLGDAKKLLRKTDTKGGKIDLAKVIDEEPSAHQENVVRDYFFAAGVDEWYNKLEAHTFRSEFTTITAAEAAVIIRFWNEVSSCSNEPITLIPDYLEGMVERIDELIRTNFPSADGVFVKLSTRSPKDSKTVFRKATAAFEAKMDTNGEFPCNEKESQANARLVSFSEEMLKAAAVRTGREAVTLLLDSWRVAEDLMYATEQGKESFKDSELQALITADCLHLFEELKASLPVPNAMLDLAWMGPGEVILIEINPLMEGLGSFKGSTGLFDFYKDEPVLTGKAPFEMRIRTEEESKESMISHMATEWRKIVYGH